MKQVFFMLLLLLSRLNCVRFCATHRWQPTRLPRPWDPPGKNTGVSYHFPLQCMKVKVKVKLLSLVLLFAPPGTVAYQAPPSMGFSRQEYWSGVPLPSLGFLLMLQLNSIAPHLECSSCLLLSQILKEIKNNV